MTQQHGFVKKRSTVTNLLVYTSYLFESLDNNKQTDSIYTDFRKAFDRVDHKILLDKIAFNGIRGNLWRWFKSYITNRTQRVVINGHESKPVSISSGVPQGSILGPLLFILFINDIHKCFKFCKYLLYADDLKIYHIVENDVDHIAFQQDLDRFSEYCIENKLQLSIDKCKVITFTKKINKKTYSYCLGDSALDRVNSIKDLGVILDSKLHLDIHIESIKSKAFKMFGFVMRSSLHFKKPFTFLHLYKSLVRSQLEYAIAVWNPFYNKYNTALEMVQKKFLRSMHYRCFHSRMPYKTLLSNYSILSLENRRTLLDAMLLYDLCHSKYDCIDLNNKLCYRVPSRATPARAAHPYQLFAISTARTNAGKREPFNRLASSYNKFFNSIDIISSKPSNYRRHIIDTLENLT